MYANRKAVCVSRLNLGNCSVPGFLLWPIPSPWACGSSFVASSRSWICFPRPPWLPPPAVSPGVFISVLLKINPRALYLWRFLKTIHPYREPCGSSKYNRYREVERLYNWQAFHKQGSNVDIPLLFFQLITLTLICLSSTNPLFESVRSPTVND